MNDLYDKIAIAKQHEQPEHTAPVVDHTEQVDVGLAMANRMANQPAPEPVPVPPKVMPIPN